MGAFGADASGGGRHGMWGPGGGVGGDVADLEGLWRKCREGCDGRGGGGTLACGNGPGNLFFTGPAFILDEVHSTERFGALSAGMFQWCKKAIL